MQAHIVAITVFLGARVIDGTGAPALENQNVILEGKNIKSISAQPPARLPAGARVIDARGKTIIPALVLAHAHLGLLKGTTTSGANVTEENDVRQLKRYGH